MRKLILAVVCACILFCGGCYVSSDSHIVDDKAWIQQQYEQGKITEAQYKIYLQELSE